MNKTFKKWFLGYCAFSPFIFYAICLQLNLKDFIFCICLMCLPLTIIWVLSSLSNPKSTDLTAFSTTFAINSHIPFYMLLAFTDSSPVSPEVMSICLMMVLGLAGVGLLLSWDNFK